MTDLQVKEPRHALPTSEHSVWEPFADLDSWARRLGQRPFMTRLPSILSAFDGIDFTPLADIEETDDAWKIEVELSGVKKKDIEVEAHGRTVVVCGERKEKDRVGVLRQRRRVMGTFRYEVTLGADFDANAITASLDDGELVVTVPKAEAEHARRIKID